MKFITFEGIEGCGKSTQAKKLHQFFLDQNINSILTREPGGTVVGEKVREILIDENIEEIDPKTELLLNFAGRLEHINQLIKPTIAKGNVVISDRFFDSTYAYQGSAMSVDKVLIDRVREFTIADFEPDITFLIDIKVEEAFKRIDGRDGNNRYEKLGLDFHKKVREGFLELAQVNSRIKIIDGSKSPEEVFKNICKYLNNENE